MYKIIGANQQEYGPVSGEQLRQWVTEGRADANTQALPEGGTEWKVLRDIPEFAGLFAAQPAPSPGRMQPVGGPSPYGGPSPVGVPAPPTRVPNYLVQAILCTLCCCLPLGIVAIIFAAQVNGKYLAGDYAGAQESSQKAKMWCWIAFGLGIVVNAIVFIIEFAAGMAQGLQNH